jgi:RNA polymerase sigma factor (sigma-70 family)
MEINPNFSANAKKDFELVQLAIEGDQKAYTDLMEHYKKPVYSTALKLVNNKDDAMDITVETFAKAFSNLKKYSSDYSFSTWLFRIATNNCIDFLRKKKAHVIFVDIKADEYELVPELQIKSDVPNPEENSIQKQQKEQIKLIIEKLPSKYQILITMYYFDDMSYEAISAMLDIPSGTVKGRLYRARELMYNILNPK